MSQSKSKSQSKSQLQSYLCIYPSGELRWFQCSEENRLDLFHMVIGCDMVENVYSVIDPICLIVDDCGRIKDPPQKHNPIASKLYRGFLTAGHDIVGPCILAAMRRCDNEYGEYDWFPLNSSEIIKLMLYLKIGICPAPSN